MGATDHIGCTGVCYLLYKMEQTETISHCHGEFFLEEDIRHYKLCEVAVSSLFEIMKFVILK